MPENSKKEEKASDSPSSYNKDMQKFEQLASEIKGKYKLSNYDLIDVLLKQRVEKPLDMIPASIFDNKVLSALEAIVKYLRENLKFGSGKIAKMLNRNISTISSTYIKAKKKMPSEFVVKDTKYFIPISGLADRHYSVLESIVKFLKKKFSLSNNEIAKLLNRDNRTIWTINARAMKKGRIE